MALLNIFRGTQAEVSARPVSDGALLFATDTKKIYLDKGSDRIEMSSVQDLSDYVTSSELEELLATKADAAHTHTDATGDASGFMSSADKTKLDGLVGLPEGGTNGQVLTKTADGEAWGEGYITRDANDAILKAFINGSMTNVPNFTLENAETNRNNVLITTIGGGSISLHGDAPQFEISTSDGHIVKMSAEYDNGASISTTGSFAIGGKSVHLITDDASSGNASALVTAKAVKDYVDENGGSSIDLPLPISQGGTGVTTEDALIQLVFNSASTPQASDTQYGVVKFASDEDFKAYMGIS